MQEGQVTIGRETYSLPAPFFTIATQNPIEQEGTYPLPEAQLDRFMFNIKKSTIQPRAKKNRYSRRRLVVKKQASKKFYLLEQS